MTSAFYNAELDIPIFALPPQGQPTHDEEGRKLLWQLNKSLPGLKQAENLWHKKLESMIKNFSVDIQQSLADLCLFVLKDVKGRLKLAVGTHVDDLVTIGCSSITQEFENYMKTILPINFKPLTFFLNISIVYDDVKGSVKLSQQAYVEQKLREYGMEQCKPSPTPLATVKLRAIKQGEKQAINKKKYASVVGGFNYPTHMTRPDFAGPLNVLQRFTANPSVEHELALGHFMRYARGTADLGITYSVVDGSSEVKLESYADASFGAPDISQGKLTGTTTTGYVIIIRELQYHGVLISRKGSQRFRQLRQNITAPRRQLVRQCFVGI